MSQCNETSFSENAREESPTAPDFPRQRRRQLKTSKERAGIKSLNDYLASIDGFRVGAPDVLRPLPLFPIPIQGLQESPFVKRQRELTAATIEILAKHMIDWNSIGGYNRRSRGEGDGDPKETIVVFISDDPTYSWSAAAQDCTATFAAMGLPWVQIEILHLGKSYLAYKYPFPKEHRLLQDWSWDTVGKAILAAVEYHLSGLWWSVGVYYYGKTAELSNPTLLITVDRDATADWSTTCLALERILDEHHIGPGTGCLEVEFTPGSIPLAAEKHLSLGDIPLHPSAGASIGVQNEKGSMGTMGGYVVLQKGEERIYCGLTTHHIVRPSEEVLAARFDRDGIKIGEADQSTAMLMSYPCHDDSRLTVEEAESTLDIVQRTLGEAQSQINDGLDSRENQHRIIISNSQINRIQPLLASCRILNQQPRLERVIASSGKRQLQDKSLMDWALIRMADQTITPNFGFSLLDFRYMGPTVPIIAIGELTFEETYAKKGRSSGVTVGHVNAFKQAICWSKLPGMPFGIIHQWEVFSSSRDQTSNRDRNFAESGDSGSFIMDKQGRVAGLLFAAWAGDTGFSGLVTPIKDVFKDIEDRNPEWTVELAEWIPDSWHTHRP